MTTFFDRRTQTPRLRVLLASGGVALVAVGCGGSGGSDTIDVETVETRPTSPTTATATPPTTAGSTDVTGDDALLLYPPAPSQLPLTAATRDKALTLNSLALPCGATEMESSRGRSAIDDDNQVVVAIYEPGDPDGVVESAIDSECDEIEIRPNRYPIVSSTELDLGHRAVRYELEISETESGSYLLLVDHGIVYSAITVGPGHAASMDAIIESQTVSEWSALLDRSRLVISDAGRPPVPSADFVHRLHETSPEVLRGIALHVRLSDSEVTAEDTDSAMTLLGLDFACQLGEVDTALDLYSDSDSLADIVSYARVFTAVAAVDPALCPSAGVTASDMLSALERIDPKAAALFASTLNP